MGAAVGDIVKVYSIEGEWILVAAIDKSWPVEGWVYDYKLFPYDPKKDDVVVCLNDPKVRTIERCYEGKVIQRVITKKSYTRYGYSNIRDVETIYLERKFEIPLER